MNHLSSLRGRATLLAGIALVAAAYLFARLPEASAEQRAELASRFHFSPQPLPEAPHGPYRFVRQVHPSLQRISAWMSSVGAAAALADLDADGLSNDLCHVEPRTDQVIVSPVPGTGDRYQPFAVEPVSIPYDAATMAPMGCIAADLNEDGLMDLLVYYWGRTPVAFLRKAGTPGVKTAIRRSDYSDVDIVPTGERWYTNAGFVADLDGDGHLDIMIGNYFKDGSHTLDAHGTGIESMHNTKSKALNGGTKRLLLWQGGTTAPNPSVRFRDVPGVFDEAVLHGWTLAAGAADLDGDMLPEVYFGHDFGPDRLLRNVSTPGHPKFAVLEGRRTFTTPHSFILGHDSFKGMGLDFGDVNGDGRLDMYVSNIADTYALQESHFLWLSTGDAGLMKLGVAPYVQSSEELGLSRSGWGWDARLADFDNDGVPEALQATGFIKGTANRWPELQALGTGNDELMESPKNWPAFRPGDDVSGQNYTAFFVREPNGGRFRNVGKELGFTEPTVSRGIAIADVDGDGRLDFALANQWETSYFYHNEAPNPGAFMGLHVLLPLTRGATRIRDGHPGSDTPGRPAIGAQAEVVLPDGRRLVAQSDGGTGHSGKRSPDIHFGLGNVAGETKLSVGLRWRDPDGQTHGERLQIAPGWHTIVLAWPETGANR